MKGKEMKGKESQQPASKHEATPIPKNHW